MLAAQVDSAVLSTLFGVIGAAGGDQDDTAAEDVHLARDVPRGLFGAARRRWSIGGLSSMSEDRAHAQRTECSP